MHVVTAGVHHSFDLARVGKPGRLPHRQRVHVRARNSTVGPSPLRSTPATPVLAMPSITSKPTERSTGEHAGAGRAG